ncbi:MAG: TetR/AcrR family transcriptional regulator, partial [Oceanobacter sp.]
MIDKRTKILQATADMIAEHGLTCSPMSKISARAGCGAGTIYRYFETKDELVVELFKETAQKLTDACLKNYQGEGSLRDRFFQIWGNYFSYINENPSERALLEQLFASPAIGPCDKESALDQ